jgi:hypothetical protein
MEGAVATEVQPLNKLVNSNIRPMFPGCKCAFLLLDVVICQDMQFHINDDVVRFKESVFKNSFLCYLIVLTGTMIIAVLFCPA